MAWGAAIAACVVAAVAVPLAVSRTPDHDRVRVTNPPPSTIVTPSSVPTTTIVAGRRASAPTTAALEPKGAQNLPVTNALRADLKSAYVAYTQFPASDISGTKPGSVYYAYLPSTKTYWAVATFLSTPTASEQTGINMQDGGDIGVFERPANGTWAMKSVGGIPFPCPGFVLPELLRLWGMQIPPGCHS